MEFKYNKTLVLRQKGLSFRQISKILNIPKTTVGNWCNGSKKPYSLWTENEKRERGTKIRISKLGPNNPNWKGDKASQKAGRSRAWRNIECPSGYERHHIDGNTLNNDPSNIEILTRKQHQIKDGRYDKLKSGEIQKSWSPEEEKILMENLEIFDWNILAIKLPKRTLRAAKEKAYRLSGRYPVKREMK